MSLTLRRQEDLSLVDESDVFERLFVAEYARVVAIARRILGDMDEVEDVAQEVFVSFHRRHPRVPTMPPLGCTREPSTQP